MPRRWWRSADGGAASSTGGWSRRHGARCTCSTCRQGATSTVCSSTSPASSGRSGTSAMPSPIARTPSIWRRWRRATKPVGPPRSADRRHARKEAQVATMPTPTDLLERIRLDVERDALRARNGLKHLAGVGRPAVGCSPKDVVWRRDKVQLYRYHSPGPTLGPPLLLVMSLVSKPYVLDLTPGNSFVEALVGRGFDVYMIDWGTPDAAD